MLNMIKHKKPLNEHIKVTTIFGYTLFALTVLSFLFTTAIPFGFSLQYPTARHLNIIVIILVFGITAILPALVSYLIGDKATHAKNKALHHYNGVLFGIAAYWVAILLSWIGFGSVAYVSAQAYPIPLVVGNILPVIFTIIIMAIVAVNYAKKQNNKTSVLHYRPFQITLVASVLIGFIYPYFSGDFAAGFMAIAGTLAIPVVITAIAYKVLARHHTTRLARLSDALIALSMGWIATWLANTFIITAMREPSQLSFQIAGILAYVVGFVVFVTYLYLRTRK
jgi:hypothetical protein